MVIHPVPPFSSDRTTPDSVYRHERRPVRSGDDTERLQQVQVAHSTDRSGDSHGRTGAREASQDAEVGVESDALKPTHTKGQRAVLMLESAELPLGRRAAPV
jgi:hypothetical protein